MSIEEILFAIVVFFAGVAMAIWAIKTAVEGIIWLAIYIWRGIKFVVRFILRVLYWIFIAPWYYVFIWPFYRLLIKPSECIIEDGLFNLSVITPKERCAKRKINFKYRINHIFRGNYNNERRYKIKIGEVIYIMTQEFYKDNNVCVVNCTFENDTVFFKCTILFSHVKKNNPGYVLLPLISNKEDFDVEELAKVLRYKDITSTSFMRNYPYFASLLMATYAKKYDQPFLSSLFGSLFIAIPIHSFNVSRAVRNNDFSSPVILNAINTGVEICNNVNQEYPRLVNMVYNKHRSYASKQNKADYEWLKNVANIALKVGCKLLVFAAGAMVGACADVDISIGDCDFGDSDLGDDNSLGDNTYMNDSEHHISYYDNYTPQDVSYINNIHDMDQSIDYYDESYISFQGKDTLPSGANSDGYVRKGEIELERDVSGLDKNFKYYTKGGNDYILYNGQYIQINGTGTVSIGGIKYKKV